MDQEKELPRSGYVIVYSAMAFSGFLVGLLIS
jgi:hypothetical protein